MKRPVIYYLFMLLTHQNRQYKNVKIQNIHTLIDNIDIDLTIIISCYKLEIMAK